MIRGNNDSVVLFCSFCCRGQFIFVVIKIISKKGREKPVLLPSGQSDHITYELHMSFVQANLFLDDNQTQAIGLCSIMFRCRTQSNTV